MLLYFIPVTILSTPLGQFVGDRLSTDIVELAGGFLITFVAVFELYRNRKEITSACGMNYFGKSANADSEDGKAGYKTGRMSSMFGVTNRRVSCFYKSLT